MRSTGARAAKSLSLSSSGVFGVCRVRERKDEEYLGKLRVEQRREINTIPSEIDEDNMSVLLPCSSSDLERVAGTRLGIAESAGTLRGVI